MSDQNEYEDLLSAQPAEAPGANEYEAIVGAQVRDEDSRRRGTIMRGLSVHPDQYARAKQVAPLIGAPPEVVGRNLADVEPRARALEIEQATQNSPVVRERLTNPDFASLAHDDIDNASAIENAFAVMKRAGRALVSGGYGRVGEGIAGTFQAGAEVVAESQRLTNPALALGLDQYVAPFFDWARRSSAATAEQIQGDISGAGVIERGIYSGISSLGQQAPAIAAGVLTGNPGLALAMMSGATGGQEYGKAREAGQGVAASATYAGNQAAWEYITEKLPMSWLVGDIEKGTGFLKLLGKQLLAELPGEQVATIVQDLNEWAVLNPDKPFQSYLDARPGAALETAVATLVGTGGNVVVGKGIDAIVNREQKKQQDAEKAQQFAAAFKELSQYTEASKLRERDPQTFQEFVQAAGDAGEVTDVWVDGRALANVLNQGKVDPATLPPSIAQQLSEAIATGGDIRIPVGEYAARMASQTYAPALLDHLKASPEAMSVAEAKQFESTAAEQLRADVEKAVGDQGVVDERTQSADRVEQAMLGELNKAARFKPEVNAAYAKLVRSFSETMSARVGSTPEEFAQKYRLGVTSQTQANATLEQGAAQTSSPRFKQWFGNSAVRDDKGEPLVVYHGTTANITEFDAARRGENTGAESARMGYFFSDDTVTAESYANYAATDARIAATLREADKAEAAGNWDAYDAKIVEAENLEANFRDPQARLAGQNVVPVYLSLQNPLIVDAKEENAVGFDIPAAIRDAVRGKHDGLVIKNLDDAAGLANRPATHYVIFRPEQVKSATGNDGSFDANDRNILSQDSAGPRGQLSFADDITSQPSIIGLLENADLSSFLHESGHFFLEVMTHVASQPDAPQDVVADVQAVMKWFGVESLDAWRAMSLEQRRDKHEKFARGFEAYLFEGKSPNTELAALFSRFRAWLINVYKSLKGLDVKLNDDVRAVFDKMIASEEQIRRAELERNYAPLFATAKAAGMTVEEFDQYQKLAEGASRDALMELEGRSLQDLKWLTGAKSRALKSIQADVAEKRKAVEKEVAAEVAKRPIYVAQRFIARGELPEGFAPQGRDAKRTLVETGMKAAGTKLSTAALKQMYGEEANAPWRYLASNLLTSSDTGLHPDQAAELLGYSSGDHLVREILAAPPIQQAIDAATDTQMLWRYGDLASPEAQERAAQAAIHNDARQRMVATEMRALARANQVRGKTAAGASVNILARAAKQFADMAIARKRILDIKPAQFTAAESRAARAAEKAVAAGKTAEAAAEKRNQLINGYAYKAAEQALEEFEKGLAYLKKFDRDGTRKALDPEYVEQIDSMLEAVSLKKATLKAIASRKSMAEWIEAQRAMGVEPTVEPDVLAKLGQRNVRELTVEEFRGLLDAVKNVEHLGRLKKKLLTAKDEREFEARVAEAAAAITEHGGKAKPDQIEQSPADRMVHLGRSFFTAHRKFASLMREFDGWTDGGVLWELLARPANEAGDREAALQEQANIDLDKVFKPLLKRGGLRKKVFIREIGTSLSLEARLVVALNQGNETNRLRITEGDGWSPAQVQAIMDTLTKEDMDFVQATWDYLETLWPEIAAKEKRVSGVEPERVIPTPVVTKHGIYRGGYYPIAYDPNRSSESSAQQVATLMEDARRGLFARRSTQRGHTKARAESVKRAVRKDFGTIFSHVQQVVHDVAWHEFIIDANRVLRAKPIDSAIRAHYGPEVVQELRSAISDMAGGDIPAITAAEKVFAHLRSGATIAGLGWNLTTAMLQPLGLTQSAVRIGPKWLARGLAQFIGGAARMENVATGIDEKSVFMRLRGKTLQREISEIRSRVSGHEPMLRRSFFYLIQQMQRVVDIPTWLGAYEKAQAEGNDEARSIALADQAVIDSQGGGQIKDLAGMQRGGQFQKLFTNFYSYFSTTYNLLAESVKTTKGVSDVPRLAVDFLMLTSVPAVLSVLIREAFSGGDDDDDDDLPKKLAQAQASYLLGLMIGMRELGSAAQGFAGYQGPAGARFFSDMAKLVQQAMQGEANVGALRAANRAAGVLFHYPSGQVERTAEGVIAIAEGDTQNPAALITGVK